MWIVAVGVCEHNQKSRRVLRKLKREISENFMQVLKRIMLEGREEEHDVMLLVVI